jgi:hypothetical protein
MEADMTVLRAILVILAALAAFNTAAAASA